MKFKKILIKLSGESLVSKGKTGIDVNCCKKIAEIIKECVKKKTEITIVVGAGNFWRGKNEDEFSRVQSDKIGMLATVMNALAFSDILESIEVKTCVLSAIEISGIVEKFSLSKAINKIKKGNVLIFTCGIGSPFFSTDTAAALRASEIRSEIIFKATTTDGVYSSDPKYDPNAVKYEKITFDDVIRKDLKIMDMTAISLCRENRIPVLVLNIEDIKLAIDGKPAGTLIYSNSI